MPRCLLERGRLIKPLRILIIATVFAALVPATVGPVRAESGAPETRGAQPRPSEFDPTLTQQLADRYAPVVYLRQINNDICDQENEGFDPVPVDVVLGRDDIPLMVSENGGWTGTRDLVTVAPRAADLYGRDAGYYLDYPGSPVRPGCTYRRDFAKIMSSGDVPFVAYAHVYLEPGTDELALQYWFYYYFNDWNNNHEGDWEMVMLFFDTTTVEEALTMEPTRVVYAQHGGGERAGWNDDKLSKEDGHPVVYTARGAHASFFESHVYLGLAENGTGFGCETTRGPHRRDVVKAIVVPHEPTGPDDPFAWLAFDGRWGELRRSEWNGPTGPNDKRSWTQPVTWGNAQRDSSLIVPEFEGFGRAPLGVFCGAVSGGSRVLIAFSRTPAIVGGILGSILVVLGVMFAYTSPVIGGAYGYFRRNLRAFLLIGVSLIPLGYAVAAFQTLLFQIPPIGPFLGIVGRFPGIRIALLVLFGGAQAILALVFVEPATIWAMTEIRRGRRPTLATAYRHGVRAIVPVFRARLRVLATALRQAVTIVGIPRAVMTIIRAMFITQVVVVERATRDQAIAESAAAVNANVARSILTNLSLFAITTLTGPLAAVFFLLAIPTRPLGLVNFLSSLFFSFLYPFGVIGMTLLYERNRGRALVADEPGAQGDGAVVVA